MAIYASVPAGSPQNAAYAEHLAAMQAAAHTEKEHQITLVVDCGSVVNSAQAGIEYATNFKRPMGGLWRRFDYRAVGGLFLPSKVVAAACHGRPSQSWRPSTAESSTAPR